MEEKYEDEGGGEEDEKEASAGGAREKGLPGAGSMLQTGETEHGGTVRGWRWVDRGGWRSMKVKVMLVLDSKGRTS